MHHCQPVRGRGAIVWLDNCRLPRRCCADLVCREQCRVRANNPLLEPPVWKCWRRPSFCWSIGYWFLYRSMSSRWQPSINLPDPFRLAVFDTQTEVGNRDATWSAVNDGVATTLRRNTHEEQQVLVAKFRQRLNVRPKGANLDAAFQLEPVDNDVTVPFTPVVTESSRCIIFSTLSDTSILTVSFRFLFNNN